MQVIGVGFGRTGTASLRQALERLGFGPCYHMFVITEQPWRARGWLAAIRGKPDWPAVFDGFGSTVDWPGAAFWKEILEAYPDARAILTVRDSQRWYESMARTIFRGGAAWQHPAVRRLLGLLTIGRPDLRDLAEMVNTAVIEREFDNRVDRDHAVAVFERRAAQIRQAVPAGRLLVFEVAQGWEPLCAFLGVPVPDEPFPHVNDAADFQRWQARGLARLVLPPVGALALAASAVGASAAAIARRRSGSRSARRYGLIARKTNAARRTR